MLATIFNNNTEDWKVYGLTEQRVQIAPTQFLIPDVCILRLDSRADDVISAPPFIVIEIMSRDDTFRQAEIKLNMCG
jgi:Uma2 family endonuclease